LHPGAVDATNFEAARFSAGSAAGGDVQAVGAEAARVGDECRSVVDARGGVPRCFARIRAVGVGVVANAGCHVVHRQLVAVDARTCDEVLEISRADVSCVSVVLAVTVTEQIREAHARVAALVTERTGTLRLRADAESFVLLETASNDAAEVVDETAALAVIVIVSPHHLLSRGVVDCVTDVGVLESGKSDRIELADADDG
jgi:hypothetical protein